MEEINEYIVIDPKIHVASATLKGTRICTDNIAGMHAAGDSVEFLARLFHLSHAQVKACIEYESQTDR